MFRIRRVLDADLPFDRKVISSVQAILRDQFAGLREQEVAALPEKLSRAAKGRFRYMLYVADDFMGRVHGFALVSREPTLRLWYLDYLAAGTKLTGQGIGGALYERLRVDAKASEAIGLLFECAPDIPEEIDDPVVLRKNVARLKFYESFGARPIEGTEYRRPLHPGQRGLPFLVFDDLGRRRALRRRVARPMCRAILEDKYNHLCTPEYIQAVVDSFRDDPVRLREPRYAPKNTAGRVPAPSKLPAHQVALVVNDRHAIHHVRERGYVESPVRISAILRPILATNWFRQITPRRFPEDHILAVHEPALVSYLKAVCRTLPRDRSVYPYVFPIRNAARPPKELSVRAGYYCIDTFTPLNHNAYLAARRAVDCTLTAAEELLHGQQVAYALVRPPGHHAERNAFGGFCYFNNCAVAAQYLCTQARVAILDLDYHHGNGQQEIFYARRDVLTVSLHGHPKFAYPYFSGFEDERGSGDGVGFNVNYALPEELDGGGFRKALESALARVTRFRPGFLIVALGLDTAKSDPTGSWSLRPADFRENGRLVGALRLPTLVVQEGGYRTPTLGTNARSFFQGLVETAFTA